VRQEVQDGLYLSLLPQVRRVGRGGGMMIAATHWGKLGRTRNLCNQVHGVFTLMPEKVNCPDCLKIMQTDLARFKAYNEGPDFINGIKCAMNVEEKK
jgi:hypothetical protein